MWFKRVESYQKQHNARCYWIIRRKDRRNNWEALARRMGKTSLHFEGGVLTGSLNSENAKHEL